MKMKSSDQIGSNTLLLWRAWSLTGGYRAAIRSADFWLSLVVCLLCAPFWINQPWWDQVIAVFPNILGYTLGGFAIFLGFGNEEFKKMMASEDELKSEYLSVSAAFLVFVWLQIVALLYAFVAKALHFDTPSCLKKYQSVIGSMDLFSSGVGYFLFIYSLLLALKAALRIFRLSRWYNEFMVIEVANEERSKQKDDPQARL